MPGDLLPGPPTAGLLPRGLHASGMAVRHRQAAVVQGAQETEQREGRLALYRAMQQLDPDTREVIHLRLAGDFSFRDIGDILDRSEVWARVRFYRGKEELARIMGGDRDGT